MLERLGYTDDMSLLEFARSYPDGNDLAARTFVVGDALLRPPSMESRALNFSEQTGWSALCGVGLVLEGRNLRPVLLSTGIAPGDKVPFDKEPTLVSVVNKALGPDRAQGWLSDAVVYGVTPPTFHVAVGDVITAPNSGTVGSNVSWKSFSGFLTAGHVANPVSAAVADPSGTLGKIAYSNDPAGHGKVVEADVAVVELAPGVTCGRQIPNTATGNPNDAVVVRGQLGSVNANIMGKLAWVFFPTYNATCGDTYFTTAQASQPGDSGAPVLSNGGELLGHVVGASVGFCTYIQDIHYQLSFIGASTAFTGIRVK